MKKIVFFIVFIFLLGNGYSKGYLEFAGLVHNYRFSSNTFGAEFGFGGDIVESFNYFGLLNASYKQKTTSSKIDVFNNFTMGIACDVLNLIGKDDQYHIFVKVGFGVSSIIYQNAYTDENSNDISFKEIFYWGGIMYLGFEANYIVTQKTSVFFAFDSFIGDLSTSDDDVPSMRIYGNAIGIRIGIRFLMSGDYAPVDKIVW